MIPKHIYTFWFSDSPLPPTLQKCVDSQKIPGYDHTVITLENYPKDIPYVETARAAKKWVKMKDYLMAHVLYHQGGIAMDADVEILLGRNYDDLLNNHMFVSREENGFLGYSLVASEAGHPVWKRYLEEVPKRWRGDDDLEFESSMEFYTQLASQNPYVTVLSHDYFFPYNHQTGLINVTENTRSFHHFAKSWLNSSDLLPRVSILIPTLGRPEGLQRCLDSIDRLYYPKHLIETLVDDEEGTVPEKVKRMYEKCTGDVIVFASNDIEFTPDSVYNAVKADKGLVSFNTGEVLPDKGNICEHFAIKRELVSKLERGEIFSTDFHHVGCDNWLWAQAEKLGEALRCPAALVTHYHFSKGAPMDDVYQKGWENVVSDRETLKQKLLTL